MRKFGLFAKYWGPVIFWMALIFGASGEQGSVKQTSRIIVPLLHWLFPHLSEDFIFGVVLVIRKCAHLSEYGILTLLVWRAFRKSSRGVTLPWRWSDAAEALWFAVLYATTDEFHQTFIPSREGCLRDVCIDTSGAIIGLLAFWVFGHWRGWWRATPKFGATSKISDALSTKGTRNH